MMCDAGVPLAIENFPGKVHHKLLAVDGELGAGGQVVIGSANFTASGFEENDEAVLRIVGGALPQKAFGAIEGLLESAENENLSCCLHSAESWNAASPWCGDRACVCADGLDNDHDGDRDANDRGCGRAFVCGKMRGGT